MHVLFVHRAFPAQFGRLALELNRRYGWKCSFVVEHLSRCPEPSPEMLHHLDLHYLLRRPAAPSAPWPQRYGRVMERAQALFEVVRALPDLRPDLVVGHGGLLPTLLLRDLLDCPFVDYCEYYFAPAHRDLNYRLDLPAVEPAPLLDEDSLAAAALRVLDDPLAFRPLGLAAHCSIEEQYSLEVAVPELRSYFEGVASRIRPRDRRAL